jgi:hypothetical protein
VVTGYAIKKKIDDTSGGTKEQDTSGGTKEQGRRTRRIDQINSPLNGMSSWHWYCC